MVFLWFGLYLEFIRCLLHMECRNQNINSQIPRGYLQFRSVRGIGMMVNTSYLCRKRSNSCLSAGRGGI